MGDAVTPGYPLATLRVGPSRRSWLEMVVLTRCALQIRSRFDAPFPLDMLVRKPEFIAQRLRERDMFVEMVMTQGRVVYESGKTFAKNCLLLGGNGAV